MKELGFLVSGRLGLQDLVPAIAEVEDRVFILDI